MSARKASPDLGQFLATTGMDLADVYRRCGNWTDVLRHAGLATAAPGPGEAALLKRLHVLAHVDDPERAALYSRLASPDLPSITELTEREQILAQMLFHALWPSRGGYATSDAACRSGADGSPVTDEFARPRTSTMWCGWLHASSHSCHDEPTRKVPRMRQLSVDMFSTVDGFGSGGPDEAPYWGYGAPGLFEWMHGQLAEEHVMLMGATSYRLMSEIVANGDDPTFPRMAELPKIVFSKTLRPPLTWANTTLVAEPVETAVPALKAEADGVPMRTIGSPSLVRSLYRLGLVDRVRVMIFPTIRGETGEGPVFADLPDHDLTLTSTSVIDERLVLLDYRVVARSGDGGG